MRELPRQLSDRLRRVSRLFNRCSVPRGVEEPNSERRYQRHNNHNAEQ
jgi:hypothetical protein